MKIYTSYFAKVRALEHEGLVPVSIARFSPVWFKGPRLLDFAASPDMFMGFKEGKTKEPAARAQYQQKVLRLLELDSVLSKIAQVSGGKDVALCCYERPGDFCHRQMVAAWLQKNGVPCCEYEFHNPAQLNLF